MFAYDCKNSTSDRKSISIDYKSNRKSKPSEFYKDLDVLLRTYIPMLGVLPLGKQGYEADDIIASTCKYISSVVEEQSSIYILSGDGDLEQCAKYENNLLSIHWIKTQPQWVVWNSSNVLDKWGVDNPNSITLMKAIVGDSSDNIRGVKGYKKAKALKVYNDPSFLDQHSGIISYNLSLLNFKDDLEVVPKSVDLSVENLTNLFSQMKAFSMLKRVSKLARQQYSCK